jgi:hypothetical protein
MHSCLGQQSHHFIRRCIPPAAERIPLSRRHIGQDETASLGDAAQSGDLFIRQDDAVRGHDYVQGADGSVRHAGT